MPTYPWMLVLVCLKPVLHQMFCFKLWFIPFCQPKGWFHGWVSWPVAFKKQKLDVFISCWDLLSDDLLRAPLSYRSWQWPIQRVGKFHNTSVILKTLTEIASFCVLPCSPGQCVFQSSRKCKMLWQRRLCWRVSEFESLLRNGRFWGIGCLFPLSILFIQSEWISSV